MKIRSGFVSNSSSSSFIIHQPKNLSFKEFEIKILESYAKILSLEIKNKIFDEYRSNTLSLDKLIENLVYTWSWELNATNVRIPSVIGYLPSPMSAEADMGNCERFFNVRFDIEKIKSFNNEEASWQEKSEQIRLYVEVVFAKVNEDEFSFMQFSDDIDGILEHEIIPKLDVIMISNH